MSLKESGMVSSKCYLIVTEAYHFTDFFVRFSLFDQNQKLLPIAGGRSKASKFHRLVY